MESERLSEVEQDALSLAVQAGFSFLDEALAAHGHDGWEDTLKRLREAGRHNIDRGEIQAAARRLAVTEQAGRQLAALALLHGGVKIGELVFCRKHYPAGREERWRFGCDVCHPNDSSWNTDQPAGRNVTTTEIEGLL